MSDNAISVGDLVVEIRACCATRHIKAAGWIFRVSGFDNHTWSCGYCGIRGTETRAIAETKSEDKECAPLSWLRRIPPLGELDEAERKESTPA